MFNQNQGVDKHPVYSLADDKVQKRGILTENDSSLFIEHQDPNILFDTG